ncbi:TIGR00730 family Rossman fold protein [Streptomyces sp. NA02950]|uniref:LOG family protein n=1 Tax=Streptomyces sp. NA02950 TaxID=2742137 RepID=UPI001590195B|nr:TIGR00730 family Rossman fold protein [Streptomyces sp. NA02950]QKV96994.1 TIGR00730 family Rossman fold protein [Streptomyces sp. NA02950]
MTPHTEFTLCVYCSAAEAALPTYRSLAEETGRAIAAQRWNLLWGGQRNALMGVLGTTVRAHGGHTTAVVPRKLAHRADTDADVLITVPDLLTRKQHFLEHAGAFLVLPGGLGTCEELIDTWSAACIGAHDKPIVILDPDGHYSTLRQWFEEVARRKLLRSTDLAQPVWTTTVADAMNSCVHDPHVTDQPSVMSPPLSTTSWASSALVERCERPRGCRHRSLSTVVNGRDGPVGTAAPPQRSPSWCTDSAVSRSPGANDEQPKRP